MAATRKQTQATLPPLTDETVGGFIGDVKHLKSIINHPDERRVWSINTTHRVWPTNLCLKQRDERYVEVAVDGDDRIPLFGSSFDSSADIDFAIERLSFIAYFLTKMCLCETATQEQFAQAERLYTAYKAEEAATDISADYYLLLWAYSHAYYNNVSAADFFTTNIAAYMKPSDEARQTVLNVIERFHA